MTDINCPMCGKENPADSEFCQHCQARLQPPGFVPPDKTKPDENSLLPEWLKRMRRINPDYANQEQDNDAESQSDDTANPGEADDGGTPEWLKRIRDIKSQEKEDEIYGKFAKPADESEQQAALQKGREFLSGGPKIDNEAKSVGKQPDELADHNSQSYQDWLRELRRRQYGDDYVESVEQESSPIDGQIEDTGALSTRPGLANQTSDGDLASKVANQTSIGPAIEIYSNTDTSKPTSAGSEMTGDGTSGLFINQQQDQVDEAIQQKAKPLGRRIKDWFKGQTDKSHQQPVDTDKPVDAGEQPAVTAGDKDTKAKSETAEITEPVEQAQSELNTESDSPPIAGGWIIPDWVDKLKQTPSAGKEEPTSQEDTLSDKVLTTPVEDVADDQPRAEESAQSQDPGLTAELAAGSAAKFEDENQTANEDDQPEQDEDLQSLIPPYQLEIPGVTTIDSGPLAGLPAIPVAQDFFPGPVKKLASSKQFELSEKDRTHALLLQSLLEGQPQLDTEKKPRKMSFSWLLKLAIAVALLTVMGYMLMNGVSSGAQGFTGGQAGLDFIKQVDALPDGSVILVGAEYDAGYSAEIELAAVDVLRTLIKKNITMVLISTVPEGPILVEDLLNKGWVALAEQDQEQAAGYVFSQRLINLGYLPGGAAALQAFIQNPQQAAPAGFHDLNRKQNSWTTLSALGVNKVSDFSAVIVITDRFESSRTWLEQVDPGLGKIPLLFITTAQALPLLLPYVQSGQAQGLLAGINDGFMAGQSLDGAPRAINTVTSYQAGIYVLIILLLIGAFSQLLTKLFSGLFRRKEAV